MALYKNVKQEKKPSKRTNTKNTNKKIYTMWIDKDLHKNLTDFVAGREDIPSLADFFRDSAVSRMREIIQLESVVQEGE